MPKEKTDYLVIGSGIAGLAFAIKAAQYGKVIVLTKGKSQETATSFAQGGIAAAIGKMDNPQTHMKDTLKAGAGLCDKKAVEILVNEGIERVQELIDWGIKFTRDETGELDLSKEGGHSKHRILHAHDYTGQEIQKLLIKLSKKNKNIIIRENHMIVDLITEHHFYTEEKNKIKTCFGAYVLDEENGDIYPIIANFTFLATGGAGRIYSYTTNPAVNTGDGVAIAYRAGCRIRNLEFIQFHPTALYFKTDPAFLISEVVRGYGAKLRLKNGSLFMHKYHELKELAPRDIVARAIDLELKKYGDDFVYLDITEKKGSDLKKRFPLIFNTLKDKFNIDMSKDFIPVIPAAHYLCGGVLVNHNAETDLKRLYAAGETASTGVHGANRLASNSLLEGLVFSHRAVMHSLTIKEKLQLEDIKENIPEWNKTGAENLDEWILIRHDWKEIQDIMWDYVGIVRSTVRLERALNRIDAIYREIRKFYDKTIITRPLLELRNIALTAQIIIRSCLERKESRGLHFSTNFPENTKPSRHDTIIEPMLYKESLKKTKRN
ncbi:MAG: L-aspartate oxidase [Spirochaetia bacterium]|nr:L-aspartate oxidase [Spirochaetia bacterium]